MSEPRSIVMSSVDAHLSKIETFQIRHHMHTFPIPGHDNWFVVKHLRAVGNTARPRWGYGFVWRRSDVVDAKSVQHLMESVRVEASMEEYPTAVTVFELDGGQMNARRQFPATEQGRDQYYAYLQSLQPPVDPHSNTLGQLGGLCALEEQK